MAELRSAKKQPGAKNFSASGRLLPWIEDAEEQLRLAVGAALAFKTLKQGNLVVAYVRESEIAKGTWRSVLGRASKLELPVIFVVLPTKGVGKETAGLSERASRWGVPGIPVDAGDAVALYRVAQESLGRTRSGDGPVLIECVEVRSRGKGGAPVDPVVQMKDFLLGRKVCTAAWLKSAGDRLRGRLAAASK